MTIVGGTPQEVNIAFVHSMQVAECLGEYLLIFDVHMIGEPYRGLRFIQACLLH